MKNKLLNFVTKNWKFILLIIAALIIGMIFSKLFGGIILGFASLGGFIKQQLGKKREDKSITEYESVIKPADIKIAELEKEITDIKKDLIEQQNNHKLNIESIKNYFKDNIADTSDIESYFDKIGGK